MVIMTDGQNVKKNIRQTDVQYKMRHTKHKVTKYLPCVKNKQKTSQ